MEPINDLMQAVGRGATRKMTEVPGRLQGLFELGAQDSPSLHCSAVERWDRSCPADRAHPIALSGPDMHGMADRPSRWLSTEQDFCHWPSAVEVVRAMVVAGSERRERQG